MRRCEDMRKSENVKDTLRFERVGSAMQRAGWVCNNLLYFLNKKDAKAYIFLLRKLKKSGRLRTAQEGKGNPQKASENFPPK